MSREKYFSNINKYTLLGNGGALEWNTIFIYQDIFLLREKIFLLSKNFYFI